MKNKVNTNVNLSIERFNVDFNYGLSQSQIESRIKMGLTNSVKKKYSKSYLEIITGNLFTFFNLLGLIVAIGLMIAKAPISHFFFVIIYIANILIGISQEIRAKICIDRLSLLSNSSTKVMRNGVVVEINFNDIVLDDIIHLGIGSQIPTDSIIQDGVIEVNESMLTGESIPVKKVVGDTLYAGSFITSGNCIARADAVGDNSYVQKLSAKAKKYKKPASEIMNTLKLLIKIIGIIIIPIAGLFILKYYLTTGGGLSEVILNTSTVVIGMIPSGMFLLTSLALAVGVIKLAKHKTLVNDLYSLEMLARVDTICFDKTGTITDGKMNVREIVEIKNGYSINEVVGSMLSNLKDNNQTAIALYNYFGENQSYVAEKILPFSSKRKFSAVTFEKIGTFAFGAPEFLLENSEYVKIKEQIDSYAKRGFRVLLLANSNNELDLENNSVPNDFSPIALIVLADNIREDAISTINWFKENGVNIKVISGDNPITVSEVSKRVGIDNADKFISLEGMSDAEVYSVANEYTVFGRVTPEQKAILVKSMKEAGHVTAMTGDGVNDILAFKEADCAVSVASGSEAARNLSHLVLMDNNFNSMPKVVHEGRRVINNVHSSSSLFLKKTLFTMIFALIVLCIPSLTRYPFVLSNMLLFEVFIIGLPSFFLSLQPNDSKVKGNFLQSILTESLSGALLMIFGVLAVMLYQVIIGRFPDTTNIYTTLQVFALTFAGSFSLILLCKPFNKYRAILCFTSFLIILVAIILSATADLSQLLGLTPLLPLSIYWLDVIVIIGIILMEIPLSFILKKLCKKIKIPSKKNK